MKTLFDKKEIKKIIGLFLVISLLSSCASYNYNNQSNDRSIKVKSDNVKDFELVSSETKVQLAKTSSGYTQYRLASFKKDNLSMVLTHPNYESVSIQVKKTIRPKALIKDVGLSVFTFGIPIVIDVFKDDFYRVSPKTREFNVHFEYKQSYMKEEFDKISKSKNPSDFENWIKNYPKSTIKQQVIDHKDSLELTIALSKETETAIDDYITSHQQSNYLKEAQSIKNEMVAARELFAKTKTDNTVAAYESFLEKYPRSLHNKEAHKLLTDAAEKVAVNSQNSTSMVNYMKTYLIPNAQFFNTTELDLRKSKISKAIDAQLIKENIKTDPKKTYDYYSNLWKSYINMRNQGLEPYLNHLEQTYGYLSKICDVLFVKVKEANTLEKQSSLIAKINSDFPSLDIYDATKNPIITTLENMQKGTGVVKLFNVGYLPHYFNNMSERDALIGRGFYTYKDSTYTSLKGITFEEISFANGVLNGISKAYKDDILDFAMNIGASGPKEISYYQNSKLVYITTFLPNYKEYSYEFDNGINLTLQALDQKINEGNSYLKSGNYDQAISIFENAAKNNFPSTISQNTSLQKNITSAKTQKAAYLQKLEQERIAAEKKREQERIAEEAKRIQIQKQQEQERIRRENTFVEIDEYEFADNSASYIGQNIGVRGWYSGSSQSGAYSDVRDMTLRSKGDNFEDLHAIMNYSYTATKDDGTYIREAKVGGIEVYLIIPKSLSQSMPNSTSGFIGIIGKLVRYDRIQVTKIIRM